LSAATTAVGTAGTQPTGGHCTHDYYNCSDQPAADVLPPVGGVTDGDWGDEEPWRIIYGQRHEIGAIVTGAWACQLPDGSVQGNDGHDVYVDEMDERSYQCERLNLSSAEARQLGQALLAAADTADGWVAR
jgi:hypothetical protein